MVITRRSVLLAGGIGLLVAHRPSRGQSAATIRRVGWLSLASKASTADVYAAFKQGMHDLGWLEGKNVEYQAVYADADVGSLDALASELIRQKVDVIVVGNATTTRATQRATKTIPIVMVSVNNPVGNAFVASLAKPGGNITGITTQTEELLGKLIGILHEVAPGGPTNRLLVEREQPEPSRILGRRPERLRRVGPRCAARCRKRAGATRRRHRADCPAAIAGRRCRRGPRLP
jgi:putative ABC transport system substrate-binding protein